MSKKVTQRQAAQVLENVRQQFAGWIGPGDNGPQLDMTFDYLGMGATPAVVWEEGPFQWALAASGGGIVDETYGLAVDSGSTPEQAAKVATVESVNTKDVWTEPYTSWALALYRT